MNVLVRAVRKIRNDVGALEVVLCSERALRGKRKQSGLWQEAI